MIIENTNYTNLPEESIKEEIIALKFDDGEIVNCIILGIFEANIGKKYMALVSESNPGDVYLYGYNQIGKDTFELNVIYNDDEFISAAEVFYAIAT